MTLLAPGEARYETHAMLLDENKLSLTQLAYGRCIECKVIHVDEIRFAFCLGERQIAGWNFDIIWKE